MCDIGAPVQPSWPPAGTRSVVVTHPTPCSSNPRSSLTRETSDPASMPDIFVAQAKACIDRSEFTKAEALYVRAKKPELAVKAYKDAKACNMMTVLELHRRHAPPPR